jgi:predicted small secreted protein
MKKFGLVLAALVLVGLLAACEANRRGIPEDAALKITGNVKQEVGWKEAEVRAMETKEAQSTI